MFVRWKWRKPAPPRTWWSPRMSAHWSAVVVESRRVDGKPRQFVVQHIASIADDMRPHVYPQVSFWRKAITKMDALEATGAERARMEATLCQKVPRPEPDVMAEIEAELAARPSRKQKAA